MAYGSGITNVFISGLLRRRYPAVEASLQQALGKRLRTIRGTRDIWCRDFMPVEISPGRYVQFRYRPHYLRELPHRRTENAGALLKLRNCKHSSLVIDGGNVVRHGGTAVVTRQVYRDNPRLAPAAMQKRLCKVLQVETSIVIPAEPGDVVGHVDGVLRLLDDRTVVMNDYRRAAPMYGQRLEALLTGRGFKIVRIPYAPTSEIGPDGIPSAVGSYVNFLETLDTIICPAYGLSADGEAVCVLEKCFPNRRIVAVRCEGPAAEGGAINCLTWDMAGDLPDTTRG